MNYEMRVAFLLLATTDCLLLTAYCLLPTAVVGGEERGQVTEDWESGQF